MTRSWTFLSCFHVTTEAGMVDMPHIRTSFGKAIFVSAKRVQNDPKVFLCDLHPHSMVCWVQMNPKITRISHIFLGSSVWGYNRLRMGNRSSDAGLREETHLLNIAFWKERVRWGWGVDPDCVCTSVFHRGPCLTVPLWNRTFMCEVFLIFFLFWFFWSNSLHVILAIKTLSLLCKFNGQYQILPKQLFLPIHYSGGQGIDSTKQLIMMLERRKVTFFQHAHSKTFLKPAGLTSFSSSLCYFTNTICRAGIFNVSCKENREKSFLKLLRTNFNFMTNCFSAQLPISTHCSKETTCTLGSILSWKIAFELSSFLFAWQSQSQTFQSFFFVFNLENWLGVLLVAWSKKTTAKHLIPIEGRQRIFSGERHVNCLDLVIVISSLVLMEVTEVTG